MKAMCVHPKNWAAAETPPGTVLGMGRLQTRRCCWADRWRRIKGQTRGWFIERTKVESCIWNGLGKAVGFKIKLLCFKHCGVWDVLASS